MGKLSHDEVKRIISDVKPDEAFWISNGHIVRNLYELLDNLQHMTEEAFSYHVNANKHDFEKWIRESVRDYDLAYQIGKTRSRLKMAAIIESRIEYLERLAQQHDVSHHGRIETESAYPEDHIQVKVKNHEHQEPVPVKQEADLFYLRGVLSWGSVGLSIGIIIGFFLGRM